jgi:hypothetical protein
MALWAVGSQVILMNSFLNSLLLPGHAELNSTDRRLTVALRVVSGVWLVSCVVQFVIWVTMAAFGNFDWPWWLFSDLGLGAIVAFLWWKHDSYHREADR